jgi:hypothetical protein
MKQPVERRLAAILAADVAGYSRLMGADDAGTAQALREHRAAADPFIAQHGGRIVKTTGDGVLIEFGSVVGAVQCAVGLQKLAAERNAGSPTEYRMEWRIGVHLGDVLIEGDDILGAAEIKVRETFIVGDVRSDAPPKIRFAVDSPLEGTGFEPSVPPERNGRSDARRLFPRQRLGSATIPERDRWFESTSLQQRVRGSPTSGAVGRRRIGRCALHSRSLWYGVAFFRVGEGPRSTQGAPERRGSSHRD